MLILRQLEHWLHQHIFKVGWLLSQNFQTTTILYYTFFLPGILLHEIVYWLAAGIFNVRADRAIQWPEAQEIGELRLNFVKLSKNAGNIRKALISAVPLLTGLTVIYFIANNIFDINAVVQTMSSGEVSAVAAGIQQLIQTPDFWLWFYLTFTIGNTMFPTTIKDLNGLWLLAALVAVVITTLLVIGVGSQVFSTVVPSIGNVLNGLASIFLVIIGMNVTMTAILGTIESVIERLTNRSATFKNGKMITMTREEALKTTSQERERERARQQKKLADRASTLTSIYQLPFPIPGAPSIEAVSQTASAVVGIEEGQAAPLQPRAPQIIQGEGSAAEPGRAEPRIRVPADFTQRGDKPSPPTPPPILEPKSPQTAPDTIPGVSTPVQPAAQRPAQPSSPFARPASTPSSPGETKSPTAFPPKPAAPIGGSGFPPARPGTSPGPASPFSRPAASLPGKPAEKDSQDEENRPSGLVPPRTIAQPGQRPPLTTRPPLSRPPVREDDDEEDDDEVLDRAAAAGSLLSRTPLTKPAVDEEAGDEEDGEIRSSGIASARPFAPSTSRFSPVSGATGSRPVPKSTPGETSSKNEEDDDEESIRPSGLGALSARLTPPQSPSPFAPRPPLRPSRPVDEEGEDEEEESIRPSGLVRRPDNPLTRRPLRGYDEDDEDDLSYDDLDDSP